MNGCLRPTSRRFVRGIIFALISASACTAAFGNDSASAGKLPIPDAGSRDRSESLIRGIYGPRIASARTPEEKAALAGEMVKAADETAGPAGRYVLLRKALSMAADAGDVPDGLAALDALAGAFQLDYWPFVTDSLRPLAQSSRDVAGQSLLIDRIEDLTNRAISADEYLVAGKLAATAEVCAARSHDAGPKLRAAMLQHESAEIAAGYAALRQASAKPSPEATLAAGRFNCFLKGDWDKGLPLLADGSDAKLSTLARADLGRPTDPEALERVADGWWELAGAEHGIAVRRLRERAVRLYRQSLPGLNGFPKLRADKRIEEAETLLPRPPHISELVVEALIDGNSLLHVTPTGIFWEERGVAKPGRHDGANAPTFVNGQPWMPQWQKPGAERGFDRSAPLSLPVGKPDFDLLVLAIGDKPGGNEIEKRDPVTLTSGDGEQLVSIPDHQVGAKWYRIRLFRKSDAS